jgi:hypothetical protein
MYLNIIKKYFGMLYFWPALRQPTGVLAAHVLLDLREVMTYEQHEYAGSLIYH